MKGRIIVGIRLVDLYPPKGLYPHLYLDLDFRVVYALLVVRISSIRFSLPFRQYIKRTTDAVLTPFVQLNAPLPLPRMIFRVTTP